VPTYEYECTKCGKVFDLFQPITEAPRRKLKKSDPRGCKCDAPVSRRIGTGGGIIFKGSGFYTTDYRSESYKKAATADSGESSKSKDAPAKSESSAGSTGSTKPDSGAAATGSSAKSDKPATKKSSKKGDSE